MSPEVLSRFIKYMFIGILVMGAVYFILPGFVERAPGDYYTEQGDILLRDRKYAEALKKFDEALKERPDHRGALMGRALVFIQTKKHDKAITELTYLIDYLNRTLKPDDRTGKGVLAADDFAGLENTVQDHTERRINEWLEGNVALWKKRPALRGHLLNTLYRLRNFVFGITPSTTRRVIKGRYELNRRALVQLLETAMENNIKVVVYITPLRMDVEIPYDRAEYDAFKKDMSGLVVSFGQSIHNHEGLVPGVFWGRKAATTVGGGAEIDFMHFQAGGHRLLADALYADVVDRL